MDELKRQLGLGTATSVVIANMIGAGIFTTTGIMLGEVKSGGLVLLCWLLGGFIALAGALCYAELATMMPRAGGEYAYLREIYGPLPAFLTGWTSFFVGFAAPIAMSALGAAAYIAPWFGVVPQPDAPAGPAEKSIAVALVLIFSLVHALGVRFGAGVQNSLTILKLALLAGFIAAGLASLRGAPPMAEGWLWSGSRPAGLGVGMLWVMFAYSGWNAAAYLGEEVREPARNLPRALFAGTLVVMLLYLGVNLPFFFNSQIAAQIGGRITVFDVAARMMFGDAGRWVSVLVFAALVSSLSAFVLIGPRVYFAMARDRCFFPAAEKVHPRLGTPLLAIAAQAVWAVLLIITGRFDQLLTYIGFALGIFPLLAVAGVFVLRIRQPQRERPFRVWGYPLTPAFFLLAMTAILVVSFKGRMKESSIALATVAAGIPVFWLFFRKK
ncbi:MAG TPA: amino acid permease [Candidatus Nitrosotenuis sp.]|nr:amino acid permease [Candidatus Nitrosotenuis sp.]